jgi:hypothetical protein
MSSNITHWANGCLPEPHPGVDAFEADEVSDGVQAQHVKQLQTQKERALTGFAGFLVTLIELLLLQQRYWTRAWPDCLIA